MMRISITSFEELSNIQLYSIMALREAVFTHEQKCTAVDLDGFDLNAIHVCAMEGNEMIGVARILPPGTYKTDAVSFGRVAIRKESRGKGYAKVIMHAIIKHIQQDFPNTLIEFSAQLYLQEFYESFGFKAEGDVYDEGGIPHINMRGRI